MSLEAVKKATMEAATIADIMTRYALVAGGKSASPVDTKVYLERMFFAWPMLCRAMADLERLAPNSAAAGMDENAAVRDVVMSAIEARTQGERRAA